MQRQKPKGPGKPGPRFKPGAGRAKGAPGGGGANKLKRPRQEFNKSKVAATDAEIRELQAKYAEIDAPSIKKFAQFPLSKKTLKALSESKFLHPTQVQRDSIGPALLGKDVLGAAVTGSGKTLAFLIPVLEHLFVNKWSRSDGVGAIIISPTRELAYQIFETLKKVGKHHDFSAGLIIGGKNLKFERTRMDQCNILICTPGRLLQHMDENPLFNTSTMEVLVLDEADRCLDMGFQKTLNSIIENFPPVRQTLLFSATQTNTVQDLARLNLKEPVYVGYGATTPSEGEASTSKATPNGAILALPELLQQSYVVLNLEDKITMLWSFIKNHLKQKIIVFVSSCKQAKYLYEIFCKLRPGSPLLALYGTLHQDRRIAIYEDFLRKSHVVMFSTDVASRGLDFPAVNWVVQLDCPEDVSQYIHRAGRSARNKTRGECLLVLTPSEEEYMIGALKDQLNINIRCVQIDPKKLFSPRVKIEAFLAQFPELRATAQRAFVSYIKSVFLQRNKRLFNVFNLDLDAFAQSLGLAVTPRVPFLEKFLWRQKQLQQQKESEKGVENPVPVLSKLTKQQSFGGGSDEDTDDSDDEDFIKVKRRDHDVEGEPVQLEEIDEKKEEDEDPLVVPKREKLVTKASLAKKALKKNLQVNSKLKFDEEGETLADDRSQMKALSARNRTENQDQNDDDDGGINLVLSKALLTEEDQYDKQRFRELVKKRHKLQRDKLRKKTEEAKGSDEEEEEEAAAENPEDADSDSDHSVDLSWLPDPDKIYKNKDRSAVAHSQPESESGDATDDDGKTDDDEDDSDDEPAYKKSKLTNKMTLMDTEAIAASLLGS
ncbi:probable ATP-dependent RNA helicase DDX10 [Drosophila takahashii]|uniref:probable ATP-dependent RNA helicase DDX10 n=1 Tax=Drosophila takahashii TaxID=29030 RepID=UPI001CF817FC|nr:probable ATP-dependent RNA helicase DDX10 [Drosophila takahashii]